ncbi:hypothetical protein GCM10022419_135820 [Nonomuraea rosea]|uniref:Cobalt transporter n=1 Tax=Nonomuraea rosea TaxID=638574 RepID=A0ABP7A9B8_9ACTN
MTTLNLPAPDRRALLQRRIRLLVAATITYNVIEAAVAITAGTIASSAALIGFGLDSVVEVASAAAVAWQFSAADHEKRERAALRVIALSFFALAAYVTFDAVRALLGAGAAEHSTPGLILAALSLVIMPFLSAAQRKAATAPGPPTARRSNHHDPHQDHPRWITRAIHYSQQALTLVHVRNAITGRTAPAHPLRPGRVLLARAGQHRAAPAMDAAARNRGGVPGLDAPLR